MDGSFQGHWEFSDLARAVTPVETIETPACFDSDNCLIIQCLLSLQSLATHVDNWRLDVSVGRLEVNVALEITTIKSVGQNLSVATLFALVVHRVVD